MPTLNFSFRGQKFHISENQLPQAMSEARAFYNSIANATYSQLPPVFIPAKKRSPFAGLRRRDICLEASVVLALALFGFASGMRFCYQAANGGVAHVFRYAFLWILIFMLKTGLMVRIYRRLTLAARSNLRKPFMVPQ